MKKTILLFFALSLFLSFKTTTDNVYICNNKSTLVYHVTKTCRAILKCKHEIITVTKADAINKYGKRACKICS